MINLQFPPHVVALGCIYLAALLSSFEQGTSPEQPGHNNSHQIAATLGKPGNWEQQFQTQVQDLQEIAHAIIDLLIQIAQNPHASTSPSTPSSPHPNRISRSAMKPEPPPVPYKSDQLMRLKIVMREQEYPPKERDSAATDQLPDAMSLGKNEGTTRFLFVPPGIGEGGY